MSRKMKNVVGPIQKFDEHRDYRNQFERWWSRDSVIDPEQVRSDLKSLALDLDAAIRVTVIEQGEEVDSRGLCPFLMVFSDKAVPLVHVQRVQVALSTTDAEEIAMTVHRGKIAFRYLNLASTPGRRAQRNLVL